MNFYLIFLKFFLKINCHLLHPLQINLPKSFIILLRPLALINLIKIITFISFFPMFHFCHSGRFPRLSPFVEIIKSFFKCLVSFRWWNFLFGTILYSDMAYQELREVQGLMNFINYLRLSFKDLMMFFYEFWNILVFFLL